MNIFSEELNQLLQTHKMEAEDFITLTASAVIGSHFSSTFSTLTNSFLSYQTNNDKTAIDFGSMYQMIERWKSEVEVIRAEIDTASHLTDTNEYNSQLETIKFIDETVLEKYTFLKSRLFALEIEFGNISVAFQSLVEVALNDMLIFHNNYFEEKGDFSNFKDISIYIHGIEDNGKKFQEGIGNYSDVGDIVIYHNHNGEEIYYIVEDNNGENELSKPYSKNNILNQYEYKSNKGRIHLIYETEFKNEHRNKTSVDLTRTLIDLGLMYGDKNIRLNAHSYGGRRALQFAMDYPEFIETLTTIGTPYNKNALTEIALSISEIEPDIPKTFKKDALQYSNYIDINSLHTASLGEILDENAYDDMTNKDMGEAIKDLYVANPENHKKIQEMYMVTVAVSQNSLFYSSFHDSAVSIESQSGYVISDIVDTVELHKIYGIDMKDPAHSKEINDKFFMEIMKKMNELTIHMR